RELLNAILSIKFTGGQWKAPPHDFPPRQTVCGHFQELSNADIWQQINETLRRGEGRDPDPGVVIVDSQSVKTTEKSETVADSTAASASKGENDTSQLSKDYEVRPDVSESMIYVAMIHLMLKRLHPS
ncbi:MAG: transposase, partial [Chloroflexota bacterium]